MLSNVASASYNHNIQTFLHLFIYFDESTSVFLRTLKIVAVFELPDAALAEPDWVMGWKRVDIIAHVLLVWYVVFWQMLFLR